MIDYVRSAPESFRRVAAICTGAFVLAEAGILDGRRATTHWQYARDLQTRFPNVKVDHDRIFIRDSQIWTSAGTTAGIDLALAMIEDDLGPTAAKDVARKLVLYHRRGGGQSQFSTLLDLEAKSDRIQKAIVYARENLGANLDVEKLAKVVHLSPRQFSRMFLTETGQSPAKAVETLRVDAARTIVEQTVLPIDRSCPRGWISNRDQMTRAFVRAYGQPPQVLRRNARQDIAEWRDDGQRQHFDTGELSSMRRHPQYAPNS